MIRTDELNPLPWARTSVSTISPALQDRPAPRRPHLRIVRDEGLTTAQVQARGRRPTAGPPIKSTGQPRIPRDRNIGYGVILLAVCGIGLPVAVYLGYVLRGMLP